MSENIVGTKQAAEILGVSISTIYRMVEPRYSPTIKNAWWAETFPRKSAGRIQGEEPYYHCTPKPLSNETRYRFGGVC